LSGTARFTTFENPLISADLFPDPLLPITFESRIRRDSAAGSGIVIEVGSVTRGGGIWVDGTSVGVCAGGNAAANDGADIIVANVLRADGQIVIVTGVVFPGLGLVNLLINGKLVGAATSVDGDFGPGWRDADFGGIGDFKGVSSSDRISNGGALTNVSMVGPVRSYYNQTPRGLQRTGRGTDGGLGSWTN